LYFKDDINLYRVVWVMAGILSRMRQLHIHGPYQLVQGGVGYGWDSIPNVAVTYPWSMLIK
jgi:hypothetical protein